MRYIKLKFDVDSSEVRAAAARFEELNKKIRDGAKGARDLGDGVKSIDFTNISENIGKVKEGVAAARVAMQAFVGAVGGVGVAVTAVVAALGAMTAALIKLGAESADTLREVKKLALGLGVTEDVAIRLKASAEALQRSFGQTTDSVNKLTTALINNYGKSTEQAIAITQKFAATLSPQDFAKAADVLTEYGASMRDMGMDADEFLVRVKEMLASGQNISKFVDASLNQLDRLIYASKATQGMLNELGIGDLPERIKRGAISGKEALDIYYAAILKARGEGKNFIGVMAGAMDALKETGGRAMEVWLAAKDAQVEMSAEQERALKINQQLADTKVLQLEVAREILKAQRETELLSTQLETSWEGVKNVFKSIADTVSVFWERIKQVGLYFASQFLRSIVTAVSLFRTLMDVVRDFDGVMKEGFEKRMRRYFNEYIAQMRDVTKVTKEEVGKRAAIVGAGAAAQKAVEVSALREAESRLALQMRRQNHIITEAVANRVKTSEQGNLELARAEAAHYEKIIALAKSLQGKEAIIDGRRVVFKKLTAEELRGIEERRAELAHKIRMAEIEREIAYNKFLLNLFVLSSEDRLAIQKHDLELRKTRLDMALASEQVTWVAHFYEQQELQKKAIDVSIEQEREGFRAKIALQKLTQEELTVLRREHDNKIAELERRRVTLELEKEAKLNAERAKIIKETARLQEENMDRVMRITARLEGQWGSFFDGVVGYTKDMYNFNKELDKTSRELNNVGASIKEAAELGDLETVGVLKKYSDELTKKLNQQLKERFVSQITTGIGFIKDGIIAVINEMSKSIDVELALLDKQIEKQRELLEISRERYNSESGRIKNLIEIEKSRQEIRDKELVDLRVNIPEAQRAFLDGERERERERFRERERGLELSLDLERRRLSDEERGVRNLENQKLRLQQRQFEIKRAGDIAEAISSGAVGVVNLWANPGFPLAIPLSVMLTAITAASVASIASQKNPYTQRFNKGTLNVTGGVAGVDSVPALLTPGEAVLPAKINAEYKEAIKAIYHRQIPAEFLNAVVKGYNNRASKEKWSSFNSEGIIEAIKEKPVSVIYINEAGFKEYIVKTIEEMNLVERNLHM